jgi:hypothetical protein
MSTDTVSVEQNEVVEPVVNTEVPVQEVEQTESIPTESTVETKEQQVPLSALQKERRKRQEIEQELKVYRDIQASQNKTSEQPADDTQYEPVTKADLGKNQAQIIRAVEERNWIKDNPEKAEVIHDRLTEFLKQRPNLAQAIEGATNRYEEAWELMDKLSPKQKAALKNPSSAKKETPGSPSAIPKAASINQAVDVMNMSDSEFATWRQSQRKHR